MRCPCHFLLLLSLGLSSCYRSPDIAINAIDLSDSPSSGLVEIGSEESHPHATALQEEAPRADPVSNAVSFDGNQYQLTSTGQRLVLWVSPEDGGKESRTLRARLPTIGRVSEIRLARWTSGGGLCAVIELRDKKTFSYACVTLAAPKASTGYDSALAVFPEGQPTLLSWP